MSTDHDHFHWTCNAITYAAFYSLDSVYTVAGFAILPDALDGAADVAKLGPSFSHNQAIKSALPSKCLH